VVFVQEAPLGKVEHGFANGVHVGWPEEIPVNTIPVEQETVTPGVGSVQAMDVLPLPVQLNTEPFWHG
jgi:hypothetical protein